MKTFFLIGLLGMLFASLFFVACTTIKTVEIVDVLRAPTDYLDKEINISGTVKKGFSTEQQGEEHLDVKIVDFQDYSLGLRCPGMTFNHNQKYIVQGRLVLDNRTEEYFLVCS